MDEPIKRDITKLVNIVMCDPDKIDTMKDGWLTPELASEIHEVFEKLQSLREKGVELYWPLGRGSMLAAQIINLEPLEKRPPGPPPHESNVRAVFELHIMGRSREEVFREWQELDLIEREEREGGEGLIDDRWWEDERDRFRKNVVEKSPEQITRILINYFHNFSSYNRIKERK
jgi:hypothetical protein